MLSVVLGCYRQPSMLLFIKICISLCNGLIGPPFFFYMYNQQEREKKYREKAVLLHSVEHYEISITLLDEGSETGL